MVETSIFFHLVDGPDPTLTKNAFENNIRDFDFEFI